MANPTFLFMNPGATTFTGSGVGFSYLNQYLPSDGWDSQTYDGGEYLQLDLGSAVNVTHVALGQADFNYSTPVVVSGSNSATFTSFTVLYNNLKARSWGTNFIVPLTTTGSFRYVRVQFYDPSVICDGNFKTRVFWAGEALVMDSPPDASSRIENVEYKTFEGVALNGNIRTSQPYAGRSVDELRFSVQSNATAEKIKTFQKATRGKRYAFWYAEDPDTTGSARLVHFGDDYSPVEPSSYNVNGWTARLRTHASTY